MLGGVNVWAKPWKTQGEAAVLAKHPWYPDQEHRLGRYFIEAGGTTHEFAAGEVSPGVWLFLEQSRDTQHLVLLRVAAYVVGVTGCFILVHGFDQSPTYIALGSALLAIALSSDWYARSRRSSSDA